MAGVPEDQLTTWAQIGAQTTSKETYATVKLALEKEGTCYYGDATIFLQGSYGNDTNIFKESDVDVVIRLDSIYTYDISSLPPPQQEAFQIEHPDSQYTTADFRQDVLNVLYEHFGSDVEPGNKAVSIKPRNNRRKADVLTAIQHKKYSQYIGSPVTDTPIIGISFFKSTGTRVVNYPTQHRDNLVAKNQASNEWFKHMIRIFKNARQKLIAHGVISEGVAPSYYIEGLLYNAPSHLYGVSYRASMENVLRWIVNADRSQFKCANLRYPLLDGNVDVTWNTANCNAYLNGLVDLWNNW